MKTKNQIDADRLDAFETLIVLFATVGMGGVIYMIVRATMAALEIAREWLALVIIPALMFAFSAAALVTCIRWWLEA